MLLQDSPVYKSEFERSVQESEKSLQAVPKNHVLFLPEVMVDPEGTNAQENVTSKPASVDLNSLTGIAKEFKVTHKELMEQQEEVST